MARASRPSACFGGSGGDRRDACPTGCVGIHRLATEATDARTNEGTIHDRTPQWIGLDSGGGASHFCVMHMSVILLANAWGAGDANPTSKHRIALELARRGAQVLWVEGAGMRTPSMSSGSDRGRMVQKLLAACRPPREVWREGEGGIAVISPLSVPLPQYAVVRWLNGVLYQIAMRFWAWRRHMSAPTLVNYVPVLAHAMNHWRSRTGGECIYHCVDRWDAFDMYDTEVMAAMDQACCRFADRVVASSADLGERCRRHSERVSVIMHGVDHAHFAQAVAVAELAARPLDLPEGPIIGFFGLLSEWVDQGLLLQIASTIPEAQLVLIGAADVSISQLQGVANIHILGPRPFADLPAYIAHFAVGIIPFEINELTRAVNPIKLREMLAAGCPVVSTPLPEVRALVDDSGAVVVADTHDDFVAACRQHVIVPPTLEARRSISQPMADETWSHKVEEIFFGDGAAAGRCF